MKTLTKPKSHKVAKMTIDYVNQLYKESGVLLTLDEIKFIFDAIKK